MTASESRESRENRRSLVRVIVTYGAALFLFLGGAILIGALFFKGEHEKAVDLFQIILPVSAAIVSFWFAGRKPESKDDGGDSNND